MKTLTAQELVNESVSLKQYVIANNIPVRRVSHEEAGELFQGGQTFGGTDYNDHRQTSENVLKTKCFEYQDVQAIHFYRNGNQVAKELIVYGRNGGYSGFLIFD